MRLDKLIGHTTDYSRKDVKELIKKKRVLVNDLVAKKADMKIDENIDVVKLDGEVLKYQQNVYIMLNKPQGVISATHDDNHRTVLDLINETYHAIFPVGRLDIDTEGLLLITNDGGLAHDLLSPKKHVKKCYYLELNKQLNDFHIKIIEEGIVIDGDEQCKPAQIEYMGELAYKLWITEGKFHQVKRMILACDSEVMYLKRCTMGPIELDTSLGLGEYRHLNDEELQSLLKLKSSR